VKLFLQPIGVIPLAEDSEESDQDRERKKNDEFVQVRRPSARLGMNWPDASVIHTMDFHELRSNSL
jgi:hypothetical protein